MKIVRRYFKTDSRICVYCNLYTRTMFVLSGEKFSDEARCGRCFADKLVDEKRQVV